MIICYSVPEILCVSDVIYIFHFGLFFCPFNSLPLSPIPPPPPPNNVPQNQKFEKMKKTPTDTIILHMNNKNYNHMMRGSWDMVCDGWMGRGTGRQADGKGDK